MLLYFCEIMSSGGEIVDLVDLSDNDDDDCVLESVVYKPKKKNGHNNIYYDNIFNENPLLAEVIEKCLNLERSEGMLRVVNRTLLGIYKEADPNFKSSSEFETVLKRTLIRLDKDPYHKFSHIKDLCETLRSSKFKKRVQLITLEKNIRKNGFEKLSLKRKSYLERRSRKQKTDVIDLDKYEETPFIDLDQNDSIHDGPIVIDDEKENNSSQDSDCCMEINDSDGKMHNYTCDKNSKVVNSQKENEGAILNIDDDKENQSSQESNDCFIEMNNDELRMHNNCQSDNNISTTNLENANNNSESSKNANYHKIHAEHTEDVSMNIDNEKQSHTAKENDYYFPKNNVSNLLVQSKQGHSSHRSPEKLLVPQEVFGSSGRDKPPQLSDSLKIEKIELEIARYKEWIVKLEKQEVTDDSFSSPYIQSNKYKEKIVKLYKELCTLTGAETTKRREVTLTVIEGHPAGPVKRLEMFLNRNIGEDGNPPFPDFNDVVKCVETANVNDNLGWDKFQVMREASALFTHCGRALQKRRQKREWSDLMSRVKAEECDVDPADNDPELLARLEANRLVAVKKEEDLLERYSMMQNLPPEPKRKTATNAVTQFQDAVEIAPVRSVNDDSLDGIDSPQVNINGNNKITPSKENETNQLDSIKIVSINNYDTKAHSEIEINKISLVQNGNLVMPQIVAGSITNKCYTDEFGLKINDSKEISNVEVNYSASNGTVKSEFNVAEFDFETNVASNKNHGARPAFESNVEANCASNIKSNVGVVNFESNVTTNKIRVASLTFESSVEANYESKEKSKVEVANFESNVATNETHVARLTFESHIEANCESNIKSNVGDTNFESNVATNKTHAGRLTFKSNVVANCELNMKSNVDDNYFESNVATNKTQVARLPSESNVEASCKSNTLSKVGEVNFESNVTNKTLGLRLSLESNVEDGNLKANILEVKFEPNVEQVITESNAEENFEPNSEEVVVEASVKTEFDEANIKTEPTATVAKILDDFGDNYTVSIFDIADPFLIVEISDSSDDED